VLTEAKAPVRRKTDEKRKRRGGRNIKKRRED
jgi:hypothetical protein